MVWCGVVWSDMRNRSLAIILTPAHLQVVFYVKRIPWFVSDVTTDDFAWVLEQIIASGKVNTRAVTDSRVFISTHFHLIFSV